MGLSNVCLLPIISIAGPDALGVATDAKPRAYRLNDLVMQCQEYNTAQAAALVKQKSPEEILLEYRK